MVDAVLGLWVINEHAERHHQATALRSCASPAPATAVAYAVSR
jgi:hypothetical protein